MLSDIISTLLLIFAVFVLLYGGRLYVRQWSLIFRPRKENFGTPAVLHLGYEDIYLPAEDEIKMHGWWIPGAAAESKTVLYFHGTTGNISYELRTINYLHSLGVNLLAVDYPGYGQSEGKPDQKGCYLAAELALRYLQKEKRVVTGDIFLYGRSLGSAVATYLAAKQKFGGLVFHSGFTSVPDMAALMYPYLPVKLFCHTRLNALKLISHCRCPVLILHSPTDEFIPFGHAQKVYAEALPPKKMIAISGSHFSSEWQSDKLVREQWVDLLNGETTNWGEHGDMISHPSFKSDKKKSANPIDSENETRAAERAEGNSGQKKYG